MQRAASQPPGAGRTAAFRASLRSATSLLLVAAQPVVGLLLVELVDRRLQLTQLHVHPEHQRRGVGRSLVAALLQRYPQVWCAQPELALPLGLVRTGREDGDAVELSARSG